MSRSSIGRTWAEFIYALRGISTSGGDQTTTRTYISNLNHIVLTINNLVLDTQGVSTHSSSEITTTPCAFSTGPKHQRSQRQSAFGADCLNKIRRLEEIGPTPMLLILLYEQTLADIYHTLKFKLNIWLGADIATWTSNRPTVFSIFWQTLENYRSAIQ
jgi:hypothetical protein